MFAILAVGAIPPARPALAQPAATTAAGMSKRQVRFIVLKQAGALPAGAKLSRSPQSATSAPFSIQLAAPAPPTSGGTPPPASDVPASDIHLVANLDLPATELWYQLQVSWDANISEEIPIYFPAGLTGDQTITIPPSKVWPSTEYTLIDVEKQFPQLWNPSLTYYFSGRSVFKSLSQDLRFSRVGVRAFRDWFLGSFELAQTSNIIGVDRELLDYFVQLADYYKKPGYTSIFDQQFWAASSKLLNQYIRLPSAKDSFDATPEFRQRWSL